MFDRDFDTDFDLQIDLGSQLAGEAVHHEVDEPDPVEWLALHSLHDGASLVDLALQLDEVFEQLFAGDLPGLEHVVIGVVLVPVEVPDARLHLVEVGGAGEGGDQ